MAIYSHPWTSIGGDRAVSDAMDAAYFAATHGNLVLTGLEPTLSGTDVSVAPGTAVIQGRVVTVDAAVTLTPVINRRARIVLRLDIANRTAEVALSGTTTSYPSLTRSGTVWELGLGTVDTTAATTVTDTRADFTLCGMHDTGWMSNQLTTATGWSLQSQSVRRIGNVVYLRLFVQRTGGDITVPTNGNITNTTVATLPTWAVPTINGALASADAGRMASAVATPAGEVSLAAVAPGGDIVNGESITIGGSYLLG